MLRVLLIKVRQKGQRLIKKLSPPVHVLSNDMFYQKHFKAAKPGSDYFLSRTQPSFFFDSNQYDKYVDFLNQNYSQSVSRILMRAEKAAEHKFDLLGSGETDLGKEIDWHLDFKSSFKWKKEHYSKIQIIDPHNNADVKVPWELSRLQHFTDIGRAFWLTEDEIYLRDFVSTVEHWENENPVDFGVNWTCPMEVAIRAINIIFGLHYFSINESLSDAFVQKTVKLLYYHGLHIEKNLEYLDKDSNSNHLISNYLGLFYLGLLFPEFDRSQKWRKIGCEGLETEIEAEIFSDGADYECSTSYHRLVTEIFLSAYILGQKNNFTFSSMYKRRLENMIQFSESITPQSGNVPFIGDNDDGFIVKLSHDNPSSHAHLIELGSVLFENKLPENISYTEESLWYFGLRHFKNTIVKRKTTSQIYKQSGYAIARNDNMHLIFAASRISDRNLAGHKHNDNLSFTLEIDKIKYFIDPGTYCYTSDYNIRNKNRSVISHNTAAIDSEEQNRFFNNRLFYLQNDAKAEIDLWVNLKDIVVISGIHKGYTRLNDVITHRRTIWAYLDTKQIKILDEFDGKSNSVHSFDTRFITPIENVRQLKDFSLLIEEDIQNQLTMKFTSDIESSIRIEPTEYYPGYGLQKPATKITCHQEGKLPFKNLTTINSVTNIDERLPIEFTRNGRLKRIKDKIDTMLSV